MDRAPDLSQSGALESAENQPETLRSWVEIDTTALRANVAKVRSLVRPGVLIAAVIKADAYGHGASQIAKTLEGAADLLAVANVTEAREVRRCCTAPRILILGPALPDERREVVRARFIPTLSDENEATAYAALVPAGERLAVHLAIDTGMGRIGLWREEADRVVRFVQTSPRLWLQALSSHLPVADEDEAYTHEQLARFRAELGRWSMATEPAAILNSAGVLAFGRAARPGDIVRTGLSIYGIAPIAAEQKLLRPVLTWKTRVVLVRRLGPGRSVSYGRTFITTKEITVATLAVGYGDGYQRHLSGRNAQVLIRGRRCPLLGRVTMDQIMVDVSDAGTVEPGTEAVLVGRQGEEQILASELADKAGTIAWEIFTGITKRVARRYQPES